MPDKYILSAFSIAGNAFSIGSEKTNSSFSPFSTIKYAILGLQNTSFAKSGDLKYSYEELERLERLEEIANHAEADYDREPENAEYEKAFDETCKNEYASFMAVSTMLSDYTGVDIATARSMVNGKRAELWDILKRAAIK